MSRQKIDPDGDIPSGAALEERACEVGRDRLSGLLPPEALEEALAGLAPEEITGPGGLITQLAGRVVEAALGAELSGHLGYPPGHAPPGGAGNVRNGSTPKTLKTELGEVRVRTPRDRQGTFEPQLVSKRQTRLAGLDERVLDLYAGGMSTRDIAEHLQRLYGVQVGRDTISRVTDAVLEDVAAWRSRPLEAVYPIVSFDALQVKMTEDRSVRTRACYWRSGSPATATAKRSASGGRTPRARSSGWRCSTTSAAAASGRPDRLRRRPLGLPEAIEAVFPQAWVQTCIVHSIRSSLRYVNYQDRRKLAASCGRSTRGQRRRRPGRARRFDERGAPATR